MGGLLQVEPGNRQAQDLENIIKTKMEKEGLIGMAVVGGATLALGGLVGKYYQNKDGKGRLDRNGSSWGSHIGIRWLSWARNCIGKKCKEMILCSDEIDHIPSVLLYVFIPKICFILAVIIK